MTNQPPTDEKKRRPERVSRPRAEGSARPEVKRVAISEDEGAYLPIMDRARCFQRHPHLGPEFEDLRCEHCAKLLTVQCPHIDLFIDDVEDLHEE